MQSMSPWWWILSITGLSASSCSLFFFFSSRRRHTRLQGDWSSDVCSSDLAHQGVDRAVHAMHPAALGQAGLEPAEVVGDTVALVLEMDAAQGVARGELRARHVPARARPAQPKAVAARLACRRGALLAQGGDQAAGHEIG